MLIYIFKDANLSGEKHWITSGLARGLAVFTAPFDNMRILKLTNAFFAAVNQMFGGSSQLPTTGEGCLYHETFQWSARSVVPPQNKNLIIAILILLFVSIIRFSNEK